MSGMRKKDTFERIESRKSFDELYQDILNRKIRLEEPLPPAYSPEQLDCLIHPEKYAVVIRQQDCTECESASVGEEDKFGNPAYKRACQNSCLFDAIEADENGRLQIYPEKCVGCEACVQACASGKLTASRDVLPAMLAVRKKKGKAYALIAPAFLGQFKEEVTPGKLRQAFQALGFDGMVEVALFADILTMKEALEFDRNIHTQKDFQLTSCCCPIWIAMIRKVYHQLLPHVPGAVSPMIAAGRVIKRLYPDAVTVFVGPCMAKKSEAREADIADAVDYVLTFQEVQDIFDAADIHPEEMKEEEKHHSSKAGRIYARTGGVSEAVAETVRQLRLDSTVQVFSEQADGVPDCRKMLERLQNKETEANFFEGMGCIGGCVGGPKAMLNRKEGRKQVDLYAEAAEYKTPLENPYVMKLMEELGFETVEELLEDRTLFTRNFR